MGVLSALALFSCASSVSNADYFEIDGPWTGTGSLIQNGKPGPVDNHFVVLGFPGARLPEKQLLLLADLNNADGAVMQQSAFWLPRNSSGEKTYIHTTRCSDGTTGTIMKTDKSVYKKCRGFVETLANFLTYQLPPNLCMSSCEGNSKCAGYTVDEQGQNCWLLTAEGGHPQDTYWKVGNA
jgi:hypothetical protein